jgi:hypothetical protein
MTIVIKKNVGKKEFEKILNSFQNNKDKKGVDTAKHCGSIHLTTDSLLIQKELRNEWQ